MAETTWVSVTWTAGDTITEAKMDQMTSNDRAVDAMAQGILFSERAAPDTPAANKLHLYAKDKSGVSTLYYLKDDATEIEIGAAEGGFDSGFEATMSASQSIPAGTDTKIQYDTQVEDLGSDEYDPATYKFTAASAGKYLFSFGCYMQAIADQKQVQLKLYKNGAAHRICNAQSAGGGDIIPNLAVRVILAATDYVEFYVYQGDTVARTLNKGAAYSYATGQRLR